MRSGKEKTDLAKDRLTPAEKTIVGFSIPKEKEKTPRRKSTGAKEQKAREGKVVRLDERKGVLENRWRTKKKKSPLGAPDGESLKRMTGR